MSEFTNKTDKQLATHRLDIFFRTAIELSLSATPEEISFGHPCGKLIEHACLNGTNALAARLLNHTQGEYRLNGAGLKLWWWWDPDPGKGLRLTVGGDQFNMYPKTGPALRKLITDNRWGMTER